MGGLHNCIFAFFVLCCILPCFSSASKTVEAPNCSVTSKTDCGYTGITQSQCESKGCCWAADPGYPWCFYSAGTNPCGLTRRPKEVRADPPFTPSQVTLMESFFLQNINIDGKGGVLASPDRNVPGGGSYYYHWMRDASLSMGTLLLTSNNKSLISTTFTSWVKWVTHVQSDADPHGIDVRTEPKFTLPDGDVFQGSWCRPQTDGPGLRSITMINYANYLIKSGYSSYVKEYLWTGSSSSYNGGTIKYDLDWVAANWQQNSCDLWEEIQSTDFFWNRLNFKHALVLGSVFAQLMGDTSSASRYATAATAINSTLAAHFNGQYVLESTNRPQDAAVILAFNDGYTGDGMFSPTDSRVAATISSYNNLFCSEYPINQKDYSNGIPGILYGRYAGDHYGGGNPWILSTAALAELLYRGATETLEKGTVPSKYDFETYWTGIMGLGDDESSYEDLTVERFSQLLAETGDAVLDRIAYHVKGSGFHLAEQIDKNTGVQCSATDLTWSYATVIKAMYYRNLFHSKFESVLAH
eukprot:TRINITY_DN4924_c0_g1_i1.p1 TRINITY_DN4924_c0_g1~~TRINITY_DN4924_c0_g1_i1.p1  ORF type:complete len:526 (-),score=98.74 TRINITY_DN4924_c0_g1_i1:46-1623(-)